MDVKHSMGKEERTHLPFLGWPQSRAPVPADQLLAEMRVMLLRWIWAVWLASRDGRVTLLQGEAELGQVTSQERAQLEEWACRTPLALALAERATGETQYQYLRVLWAN